MSIVIDDLIKHKFKQARLGRNFNWYIVKPKNHKLTIYQKLNNCYLILTNKAFAYHFEEDQTEKL